MCLPKPKTTPKADIDANLAAGRAVAACSGSGAAVAAAAGRIAAPGVKGLGLRFRVLAVVAIRGLVGQTGMVQGLFLVQELLPVGSRFSTGSGLHTLFSLELDVEIGGEIKLATQSLPHQPYSRD